MTAYLNHYSKRNKQHNQHNVDTKDCNSQLAVTCSLCGQEMRKSKLCAKCRSVCYCNKACQSADWKNHRAFCAQMCKRMRQEDRSEERAANKTIDNSSAMDPFTSSFISMAKARTERREAAKMLAKERGSHQRTFGW